MNFAGPWHSQMPLSDDKSCEISNTLERQVGEPEIIQDGFMGAGFNATYWRFPSLSRNSVYPGLVFTRFTAATAVSVPITITKQNATMAITLGLTNV